MSTENELKPPFTSEESDWAWEVFDPKDIQKYEFAVPVIKETLEQLSWLIGRWQSTSAEVIGSEKTIPFKEQLQFSFTGQPCLNYRSRSWNPINKMPMHFECGFLRLKPATNQVALVTSHNFGVTMLEEGTVDGKLLRLTSKGFNRMTFAKDPAVKEFNRTYSMNSDGALELTADMATEKQVLKNHLIATYVRIGNKF